MEDLYFDADNVPLAAFTRTQFVTYGNDETIEPLEYTIEPELYKEFVRQLLRTASEAMTIFSSKRDKQPCDACVTRSEKCVAVELGLSYCCAPCSKTQSACSWKKEMMVGAAQDAFNLSQNDAEILYEKFGDSIQVHSQVDVLDENLSEKDAEGSPCPEDLEAHTLNTLVELEKMKSEEEQTTIPPESVKQDSQERDNISEGPSTNYFSTPSLDEPDTLVLNHVEMHSPEDSTSRVQRPKRISRPSLKALAGLEQGQSISGYRKKRKSSVRNEDVAVTSSRTKSTRRKTRGVPKVKKPQVDQGRERKRLRVEVVIPTRKPNALSVIRMAENNQSPPLPSIPTPGSEPTSESESPLQPEIRPVNVHPSPEVAINGAPNSQIIPHSSVAQTPLPPVSAAASTSAPRSISEISDEKTLQLQQQYVKLYASYKYTLDKLRINEDLVVHMSNELKSHERLASDYSKLAHENEMLRRRLDDALERPKPPVYIDNPAVVFNALNSMSVANSMNGSLSNPATTFFPVFPPPPPLPMLPSSTSTSRMLLPPRASSLNPSANPSQANRINHPGYQPPVEAFHSLQFPHTNHQNHVPGPAAIPASAQEQRPVAPLSPRAMGIEVDIDFDGESRREIGERNGKTKTS